MISFHRHEHKVPGLNTTSTADISFMLLIFFLVTTNMDIDKGLQRQLPPADKQQNQESYAEKNSTMAIAITADNHVLLDSKPFDVKKLRSRIEAFVRHVGKKHLITLSIDPVSSYDTYFHVQNELVAAYNNLRDETAMRLYGRKYNALSQGQKDNVKDACPQRIAEQYKLDKAEAQTDNSEKGGKK